MREGTAFRLETPVQPPPSWLWLATRAAHSQALWWAGLKPISVFWATHRQLRPSIQHQLGQPANNLRVQGDHSQEQVSREWYHQDSCCVAYTPGLTMQPRYWSIFTKPCVERTRFLKNLYARKEQVVKQALNPDLERFQRKSKKRSFSSFFWKLCWSE